MIFSTLLDDAAVATMRAVVGDARIVLMARNPVDRAWSQARMLMRHRKKAGDPIESLLQYCQTNRTFAERLQRFGSYADILRVYGRHFDRIHTVLYEDIVTRPAEVVAGVCEFAGVDAGPCLKDRSLHQRKNVGGRDAPPDEVFDYSDLDVHGFRGRGKDR